MTIYFDHNATTMVKPEVLQAVQDVYAFPANPSSIHEYGRNARRLVEEARQKVAKSVGMKTIGDTAVRVFFTSTGTEANNMVMQATPLYASKIIAATEHASIFQSADEQVEVLPVDSQGIVRLRALEGLLQKAAKPCLVSVMLANNETGVIQPMKEIVALAHEYDAVVHTDAVQAYGKINIDLAELGVDAMTVSAHKCGGLQGAAALIAKKHVRIQPFMQGGGQELGIRPGTENVAAIVGFGKVAEKINESIKAMAETVTLRDKIENAVRAHSDKVMVFGQHSPRLPNTACVSMPGVKSETQLMHFDMHKIAVSAGSACSSGKVTASHVLHAMVGDNAEVACAIRISLGTGSTTEEVDQFLQCWQELYQRTHVATEVRKAA